MTNNHDSVKNSQTPCTLVVALTYSTPTADTFHTTRGPACKQMACQQQLACTVQASPAAQASLYSLHNLMTRKAPSPHCQDPCFIAKEVIVRCAAAATTSRAMQSQQHGLLAYSCGLLTKVQP